MSGSLRIVREAGTLESSYMQAPLIPSPAAGILALERAVRGQALGAQAGNLTVREVCAVLYHLGRTPELKPQRLPE